MIDANDYLKGLEARLTADGCQVTHEKRGLVGYKAQMHLLMRAHVFLVAATADTVDADSLTKFSTEAVNLAVSRKGQWRGAQSGVIVLPVIVAGRADPGAVAMTKRPFRLNLSGFAVMAQPAVVDLAAGRSHIFRGVRIWGYAFNSLIKKKLVRYLPAPESGR